MRWLVPALLVLALGCDKSTKITFSGATVNIDVAGSAEPPPPPVDPPPGPAPTLEVNADLAGVQLLPATAAWYQSVDHLPAHPRSREIILATEPVVASLGRRTQNDWGPDLGMPYAIGSGHPPVAVEALYAAESDPGPHPVPLTAPIENGSDKHLLYFDRGSGKLFELFLAERSGGGFKCGSVAVWDSRKDVDQRTLGWTSADAAGLPILPGLVRLDEFKRALAKPNLGDRHLDHALRYTLKNTGHGFIWPARHYASLVPYSLPGRPPMGMRVRVKKTLDLSQFNEPTQVLLRTLQVKGGICADNGANWFVGGTQDPGWGEYWDAITGNVDGKKGFKSFAGALFDDNVEVIDFKDSEVVTQVE